MKKRLQFLILPIVTLILEILPYGAVCNFANPEGEPWRETYSYFDLLPFGYANFAPLITAIATCVIFILLALYCVTGMTRPAVTARNTLVLAVIISLCPLLLGIRFFSVVGALITLSLGAELFVLHREIRRNFQ